MNSEVVFRVNGEFRISTEMPGSFLSESSRFYWQCRDDPRKCDIKKFLDERHNMVVSYNDEKLGFCEAIFRRI